MNSLWRYPARRGVRTLGSWPKSVVALPDRPVALFGFVCGGMALSGPTPFSPSLEYMGPTDEHPHMYDTDMIVSSYIKHLQSTSDDIRHWVLYIIRHVDMKDRTPTPTLANRGPTSSISLARPDIATGSQHLMHALYMLNAQYLNAQASTLSANGSLIVHDIQPLSPEL
jgi:hypothetical protein